MVWCPRREQVSTAVGDVGTTGGPVGSGVAGDGPPDPTLGLHLDFGQASASVVEHLKGARSDGILGRHAL